MPRFDVVSEVDRQEVRNAVDQAQREIATRFDFKNTDSSIEQNELVLTLRTVSEDRLNALRTVLEEKLVKRGVSLKGLDYGKVEEATQNTVRQVATLAVGISSDKAREINKLIKSDGPKGVSSQTQGDAVRVSGKKRDDLQADHRDCSKSQRPRGPAPVHQLPRLTRGSSRLCLAPHPSRNRLSARAPDRRESTGLGDVVETVSPQVASAGG